MNEGGGLTLGVTNSYYTVIIVSLQHWLIHEQFWSKLLSPFSLRSRHDQEKMQIGVRYEARPLKKWSWHRDQLTFTTLCLCTCEKKGSFISPVCPLTDGPVDQLQAVLVLADQGGFDVFHDVPNVFQGSGHHGRAFGQCLQSAVHAPHRLTPAGKYKWYLI